VGGGSAQRVAAAVVAADSSRVEVESEKPPLKPAF